MILHILYLTQRKTVTNNLYDVLYSSTKRYKPKIHVAYVFQNTLKEKGVPSLSSSKKP